MEPAHGPPLQARVAAANRTVLQLANMLSRQTDDPGTHGNEQGAKQNDLNGAKRLNGGKNDEKGSGHGKGKMAGKQKARRIRPLQANTAGRLSARHRP